MRGFANLFLLLFLLSAALGLVTEAVRLFAGVPALEGLRQDLFGLCLLAGVVLYLCLGLNRHLPKRLLLPLFAWLLWSLLGYWPLRGFLEDKTLLFASCGQLLLGAALLRINRQLNRSSLLLTRSQFAGPAFSGMALLRFCLVNLLILPPLVVVVGGYQLSALVESKTAGFVTLKPSGLYLTERIYQLGDKQLHLTGMIHLGRQAYYEELAASLPQTGTLILAEGVSDREGRLTARFGYGKIADLLGLSVQDATLFEGRLIEPETLDRPATGERIGREILRADLDLRDFDPHTVAVLNALAKYLLNADSPVQGYVEFNRWAEANMTAGSNRIIMADLIDKRNDAVLSYLNRALDRYDTFIVPWKAKPPLPWPCAWPVPWTIRIANTNN